jgi:hypothetical protein
VTLRDWADPFLSQAAADLAAARACKSASCPATFCMLLQMTFEKLGKAAFARRTPLTAGHAEPPHSHKTASSLLDMLRRSPGAAPIAPSPTVYAAVVELENAHPDVAKPNANLTPPKLQQPQLEFPWIDPTSGTVKSPTTDLPIARRVADPNDLIGAALLKFADALIKNFNELFPPHPR